MKYRPPYQQTVRKPQRAYPGSWKRLITHVQDRAGHDFRYAVDCTKIKSELGWRQATRFEDGLNQSVRWYLDNHAWLDNIKSGAYRNL